MYFAYKKDNNELLLFILKQLARDHVTFNRNRYGEDLDIVEVPKQEFVENVSWCKDHVLSIIMWGDAFLALISGMLQLLGLCPPACTCTCMWEAVHSAPFWRSFSTTHPILHHSPHPPHPLPLTPFLSTLSVWEVMYSPELWHSSHTACLGICQVAEHDCAFVTVRIYTQFLFFHACIYMEKKNSAEVLTVGVNCKHV